MTGQLTNLLSFRRIADTPFDTYMAALDSWQLTRHDGELRLGNSLLRGPIERDRHFGTCRIQVRLARRPLRPPVRMWAGTRCIPSRRDALRRLSLTPGRFGRVRGLSACT